MSKTPRTDAIASIPKPDNAHVYINAEGKRCTCFSVVDANFARTLEQELNQSRDPIPAAAAQEGETAKKRYEKYVTADEHRTEWPLENLRFFCSLAISGQDWLDVEPFFDACETSVAAANARADETERDSEENLVALGKMILEAARQKENAESAEQSLATERQRVAACKVRWEAACREAAIKDGHAEEWRSKFEKAEAELAALKGEIG